MPKRNLIFCFSLLLFFANTYGQKAKIKIKTDSSIYNFKIGSEFQLELHIENSGGQKIRLQGLINYKIDSFLHVYSYADTYFSKDQKKYVHFGCKIDIDPISGWQYLIFYDPKFFVKASIMFSCLEHVGYFKTRLHLDYQLGNELQWKTAISNWFLIKVTK